MRRLFKFLIALNLVLLVCVLVFLFRNNVEVVLHCNDEELVKYVNPVVKAIKKEDIFDEKKVGLYVANFLSNENKIVSPDKEDDVSVIWLGGRTGIDVVLLRQYDYVFASSYSLRDFLIKRKVKAYYLPMVDYDERIVRKDNKNRIFGIIGNHPIIEKVLKENGLQFKRYTLENVSAIEKDLKNLEAVFANNTNIFGRNLDLHPIFYKLLYNKVAVCSRWSWPSREMLKIFNNTVSYYNQEQDARILIDEILSSNKRIIDRKEEAYNLVKRHFSQKTNTKRLKKVFNHDKEYDVGYEKGSINIDVIVTVGHISGGDYWLSYDLLDLFFDKEFTNKRVTYLNSLIKYRTEYNIVVCGILPSGKREYVGEKNILYIAYPSFENNKGIEVIKDVDDYIEDIKSKLHDGNGVDLVISASYGFAKELNKRGIKTYYIPQFTNIERFYPDYHEEYKSDVLFVGVNTNYRKAWKYLKEEGIDVSIYGPYYPDGISKENYLDNRILRKYYSSAKIVLNDTREGMKKYGFISNRIFDASASGALVISDYMKEIEDVYGDSVVMWKTKEELIEKVKYYLDPKNENERKEKANRAREITLKNFTNQVVAQKFRKVIDEVKKKDNE